MDYLKKFFLTILLLFFIAFLDGCKTTGRFYYSAPTILPHTTPAMKTAGFWISYHPFPDKVILHPQEVEDFNNRVRDDLKLTKDILKIPSRFSGEQLKIELERNLVQIISKDYYDEDGRIAGQEFFDKIKSDMAFDTIPDEIDVQYGFIVHFADQRFFPTNQGLYEKAGDIDFDELQNSDLDVGTPVVVLHQSRDNKWLYVMTDIADGWVKTDLVALCAKEEIEFARGAPFVVVTKAKADIFLDEGMNQYYDFARMGTRFVFEQVFDNDTLEVRLPVRNEEGQMLWRAGYMSRSNVHQGFLPYTPRHILQQAFELLNEPYGWGGMHGEQDCSRLLHEVFDTIGINLPRNSKEQAQVGRLLAKFNEDTPPEEKLKVLREQAISGITLLPMKGHIMLYLGMVEDRPYAIHSVWAYREPVKNQDVIRVINRVALSDLSLGEGSKKGSLLKRLSGISTIEK